MDNDLKRGNIAKKYNLRSISEKGFNSIDETTLNDYRVYENFYVIPRVKGLGNSFQFLYSYKYKEKLKIFKDNFDFIIFDTGPILSVADSSILIEQSDFNILVTRHGVNRMNEIKQSIDNFKQINKNIDGIVYNAYAKPKSYYGYYGIYGNYSYQYYADKYLGEAYEYDKKLSLITILVYVSGCSLSPGMHMETQSNWLDESKYVYVESIDRNIELVNISKPRDLSATSNYLYKIGIGDQVSVTIWGLPEIFPINVVNSEASLRRVDANGNIFFLTLA